MGDDELGHGEVVGQVDAEDGVVAVAAVVVLAVGSGGDGKVVATRAAGAHRLVEGAVAVEAAGAAVNVVAAAIVAAGLAVKLAEKGGVDQGVGIHVEGHDVEVLAVGAVLVGIGGCGEVAGAVGVPRVRRAAEAAPQEDAAPSAEVDAVADVHHEGRGRQVGLAAAVAEHGAPHQGVEPWPQARQELPARGDVVVGVVDQGAAVGLRLAEEEDVAALAAAHEIALVVGRRAEEGAGHHGAAVVGYLGDEAVGTAAAVAGVVGPGGGGEIVRVGAAGNDNVVVGVAVDRIDGVVLASTQVGAPHQVLKVVVNLEHHAVLLPARCGLYAVGRHGEVGREGGAAHIDIVEVVGDELAAGTVAIVVVERVVANHDDFVGERIAVVKAVVASPSHVGRGLELAPRAVEARYEEVAALRKIDGGGPLVLHGCATVEGGVVGPGGGGKVGGTRGAENHKLVERVDEHAVRHVGVRAAKIGGIEAEMAAAVELEDAHVGVAVVGVVVRPQRGGIAHPEHQPRGVGVLLRIVAPRGAPVVGSGAGVGREMEIGVDDERQRGVVVAKAERYAVVFKDIMCGDFNLLFTHHLVGVGFQLHDVENRGAYYEVAILQPEVVDAFVAHGYGVGRGSRTYNEVVFHGLGGGIKPQVDAVVEVVVEQRVVDSNARGPARGVVADEIVLVAALAVGALNAGGS